MTAGRTINTGGDDYREINNEGNYAEGDIINLSIESEPKWSALLLLILGYVHIDFLHIA